MLIDSHEDVVCHALMLIVKSFLRPCRRGAACGQQQAGDVAGERGAAHHGALDADQPRRRQRRRRQPRRARRRRCRGELLFQSLNFAETQICTRLLGMHTASCLFVIDKEKIRHSFAVRPDMSDAP